jgi:hypothetical protein
MEAGTCEGLAMREEEERVWHEILRKLERIERLLEFPTLTVEQVGDIMSIGSIAPGATGQFAGAINFPAGVTPPTGFSPTLKWSSSDSGITFAPATADLTNGAIPLAQQVIATVPTGDTNTTASVGFSIIGTDGVTVLTSNVVSFTIPQAPPPPPVEPTLVASQVG